ncbi:hypothetical protein MMC10_003627 [Thelotrema lepadinum]|nr:hypothetical protein [Thelotrema lepadinum]
MGRNAFKILSTRRRGTRIMSDSENDPFVEKEKRDKKEGTEEIGAEDEGAEAEGDEAEGDEVEKEDEIFPHLGIEARNEAAARQILGCPRVLRDADDSGPGHPHHGFQFELTNLWCVECIGACWHCQSTCCAIYEAKEEMKNNREALGKKKIKSSAVTPKHSSNVWNATSPSAQGASHFALLRSVGRGAASTASQTREAPVIGIRICRDGPVKGRDSGGENGRK